MPFPQVLSAAAVTFHCRQVLSRPGATLCLWSQRAPKRPRDRGTGGSMPLSTYPVTLLSTNRLLWEITIFGQSFVNGPFSIAMWNHRRVNGIAVFRDTQLKQVNDSQCGSFLSRFALDHLPGTGSLDFGPWLWGVSQHAIRHAVPTASMSRWGGRARPVQPSSAGILVKSGEDPGEIWWNLLCKVPSWEDLVKILLKSSRSPQH